MRSRALSWNCCRRRVDVGLGTHDFQLFLDFITEQTGISLPDTNYRNVSRYLEQRMLELDTDPAGYLQLLQQDNREYDNFINIITINETYFFREEKHFLILDKYILPELLQQPAGQINVWSAACSSGEEAISLAAVILKHRPGTRGKSFTICATDISPEVITIFKQGRYTANSFRQDGQQLHCLLDGLGSRQAGDWLLTATSWQHFQVQQLNLSNQVAAAFPQTFQIIFLRNTLIYMQMATRLTIIDKIVKRLAAGGYLFLSTSETALISHPELELVEQDKVYFFRKTVPQPLTGQPPGSLHRQEPEFQTGRKTPNNIRRPKDRQQYRTVINTTDLYAVMNTQTNNSLFLDETTPEHKMARQLLEAVRLINANATEQALRAVAAVEKQAGPNELTLYLQGYMEMVAGKPAPAITCFRKALCIEHGFWLARFYLAKLLTREAPANARREFNICLRQIRAYINSNDYRYQFLLEGFNARYFETICSSQLESGETGFKP